MSYFVSNISHAPVSELIIIPDPGHGLIALFYNRCFCFIGEVFKIKKSSHSRKVAKQLKKLSKKEKEEQEKSKDKPKDTSTKPEVKVEKKENEKVSFKKFVSSTQSKLMQNH